MGFVGALLDPNVALVVLFVGILLIYVECNLPGKVVPGCVGGLLVLLALHGLGQSRLHGGAVAEVVAGLILLVVEIRFELRKVALGIAGVCMVYGLRTLVDSPSGGRHVQLRIALVVGVGFTLVSYFLGRVAMRARQKKQVRSPKLAARAAE